MRVVLTGASSGLGLCIKQALEKDHWVIPFDRSHADDVTALNGIQQFARGDTAHIVDVLINCAGINGINWCEDVTLTEWNEIMDTNARGIFLMTQALLPQLQVSKGTVLNIVSNAAHIPMTASAAYNASKAAALMLTKQLARELTPKYGITVFSISPNKLFNTGMSRQIEEDVCRVRDWTPEYAAEYQKKALLTGAETPPQAVADFIAFLLSSRARHIHLSGCDIPYGA